MSSDALTPFDTNWQKGSGATPLTTQGLFFGGAISIPTSLPIFPFLTISCRFARELKGTLSSRYLRRQHQTNYFAVRFSQGGRYHIGIDGSRWTMVPRMS